MFTIALYNLKGGVGKTASCVNFACMAALDGYRTLLWDLDSQGAASFYYKAEPKKGVAKKLLTQAISIDEVVMDTEYEKLDIIPADLSARKLDLVLDGQKGAKKQIKSILKDVAYNYDFVFIDCPPGFSVLADNIFMASDIVLMPVVPTTLSRRTYDIVKEYFSEKGYLKKLMFFFSMVDSRKTLHNEMMDELISEQLFFEYYIPYLSDIEKMGVKQSPLAGFAPNSYAAKCYRALWEEIKEGVLE